jgi:hypothetical protein
VPRRYDPQLPRPGYCELLARLSRSLAIGSRRWIWESCRPKGHSRRSRGSSRTSPNHLQVGLRVTPKRTDALARERLGWNGSRRRVERRSEDRITSLEQASGSASVVDRPRTAFVTKSAPLEGRCTLSEANRCGDDLTLIASRDRFDITSITARSLDRLEAHLDAERFRGYDPYDALSSLLFRLPVLRSSRWLRIAAERAPKRSPVNLRLLLGIPKRYNPVTLAFILESSAYRARVDPQRADAFRARAAECVARLARSRTGGYGGDCWGYPCDWEARCGRLPGGSPTIVTTGIVTNSRFTAYRLLQLDLEPSGQTAAYVACQQRDDGADWTVRRMHCPNGHFAYQLRRRRVVRIPHMPWASTYMYVALSRLAYALANEAAAA